MRHQVVTRTVIALGAVLAAACLLFARIVTSAGEEGAAPAGGVADGAALFERRCAGCHAPADVAASRSGPAWADYLRQHGYSAADENGAIAEFLRSVAQGR